MSGSRVVRVGVTFVYPDEVLGSGSEGVQVLRGTFRSVEVAVKRIIKTADDKIADEAKLLKENQHEYIVKYYDYGFDDTFHYIAMEKCAGTLEDLVNGSYTGPSIGDNNTVLYQITAGLAHLHSKNIVHRDLKPRNILISLPVGSLPPVMKLADFGISKKQKREFYFSNTGSYGTVGWAAPELFDENNDSFKLSIDIFSLGCIFGYVLTKQHPFGETLVRSANIVQDKISWVGKEKLKDRKMKELIKSMISNKPKHRPDINAVLKHFPKSVTTVASEPKSKPATSSKPVVLANVTRQTSNGVFTATSSASHSSVGVNNLLSPNSATQFTFNRTGSFVRQSSSSSNPASPLPSALMRGSTQNAPVTRPSLSDWTVPIDDQLEDLQRAVRPPIPTPNGTQFNRGTWGFSSMRETRTSNLEFQPAATDRSRYVLPGTRNSTTAANPSQQRSVLSRVQQFEATSNSGSTFPYKPKK